MKPKKETKVTISKKEYDELNYKLRHMVGLAIENRSLRKLLESSSNDIRSIESIAEYVDWREVLADHDASIYMGIESFMCNNQAMTAVKSIRAAIKSITGFEPGLVLSKKIMDTWRAKLK